MCICAHLGHSASAHLNAKAFNQKTVQVYGGMQTGLPLANASQRGLLVQGMAYPVLGNWVGNDQTLDIYIAAGTGVNNPVRAANVVHNWPQGQPLSTAIQNALSVAFPGFTTKINISPNLTFNYTDTGFYQTLGQYATYIFNISKGIMNNHEYAGVNMAVQGKTILVSDGTVKTSTKQIAYTDLIGQPIWTGVNTIQFKTVMRGDIGMYDTASSRQPPRR